MNGSATQLAIELHERAKAIATKGEADHWSRLAGILVRIEAEQHYKAIGPGYASARAYAEHELDLGFNEFTDVMRLGKMVRAAPQVPASAWLEIPKTHALQLRRVLANGGDPAVWIAKAREYGTAEKLRRAIDQALGKEQWVTLQISMPAELAELTETALEEALLEATGDPSVDKELSRHRSTRFRCWEVLLRRAQQGGVPPGVIVAMLCHWMRDANLAPTIQTEQYLDRVMSMIDVVRSADERHVKIALRVATRFLTTQATGEAASAPA